MVEKIIHYLVLQHVFVKPWFSLFWQKDYFFFVKLPLLLCMRSTTYRTNARTYSLTIGWRKKIWSQVVLARKLSNHFLCLHTHYQRGPAYTRLRIHKAASKKYIEDVFSLFVVNTFYYSWFLRINQISFLIQ